MSTSPSSSTRSTELHVSRLAALLESCPRAVPVYLFVYGDGTWLLAVEPVPQHAARGAACASCLNNRGPYAVAADLLDTILHRRYAHEQPIRR